MVDAKCRQRSENWYEQISDILHWPEQSTCAGGRPPTVGWPDQAPACVGLQPLAPLHAIIIGHIKLIHIAWMNCSFLAVEECELAKLWKNFLLQKCISGRLFNQGMSNFRICEKICVWKMCMSQITQGPQSLMVSRVTGTECREEEKIFLNCV